MRRVAEEVARLPGLKPEHWRILELYARGFPYGEIGHVVGCSEGAVRQVMSRTRRRIRQAVEDGALTEEATATLRRCLALGAEDGNGEA